jgi:hypothetical protein
MNHLNISARVVDRWLKKRGWKRTSTTLGGLAYIDPETKTKRPPAIAVQTQMEIEVRASKPTETNCPNPLTVL